MRVTMQGLKADLSHCIARARAGAVIEVASRGKPIVHMIGIPATGPAGVARLLASGAAIGGGSKPALLPAAKLSGGGKTVSEMVLEDRG